MLRKLICPIVLLAISSGKNITAQDWVSKMKDPSVNFYDVQKSFNKYWKKEERIEKFKKLLSFGNKTEEENEGYTMYKRWEDFVEPRVFPSGDRKVMKVGSQELQKTITNYSYKSERQAGGSWVPMGPFTVSQQTGGGAGRLNCIRFHPVNKSIMYVGTPAGGLWKSTDTANTWTTNTDDLPTLGINDVAIDPTDPNVMYIATGDVDGDHTYSVGILKSTDGGTSWNITGLNWNIDQAELVSRILINPNDHTMIFAGTSNGVFKSTDAGITWTKVLNSNNIYDIEFKPGDPSVIYAAAQAAFYKSTNTGASFSILATGLPTSSAAYRLGIAVTPADPSYVYLLYCSQNPNFSFKGLYRSTDSGASFTLRSNSPNIFDWSYDGSGSGGIGWYALSMAVSPVNKDEIIVGSVNVWKSDDGGINWILKGHWFADGGVPYVHADIHDLSYNDDGTVYYVASDGGLYVTADDGLSWQNKSNGMQIGQMYKLGCAAKNADKIMQGWQDNGSNMYDAGIWKELVGGDGMETFIDWSDEKYMYAETQYGGLHASTDSGLTFNYIAGGITESGVWVTPWLQDPVDSMTIYAGFQNVWKSTDRGINWTPISTFNSGGLRSLVVAPSNPQYIYASTGTTLYKTVNGGTSWTNPSLPSGSSITYIAVSATDPDKLWITRSGYTATDKVYKSIDGGTSWINMSAGLPNIPINCVVNQTNTNDGIYVGTDLGVYYTDNNLTAWIPFSNGLPNVIVRELEIHYGSDKLRAATFGRGLWETPIYDSASTLPFANFVADVTSGCPGLVVQFTDTSANSPTAWSWKFPGGTPDTSSLQNPVITYNIPGTYNNVTLIVTNANGTDSVIKQSYIAISPQVKPTITLNKNDTICVGQIVSLTASNGNTYKWYPNNQIVSMINVNTSGTYSVAVTDAFGCKDTSLPVSIYVAPLPSTPTITESNDTLYSSAASGNQWYINGTAMPDETNSFYVIDTLGSFTVKVIDSITGCSSNASNVYVGINELNLPGIVFSIYPNPTEGSTTLMLQSQVVNDIEVKITDVLGKEVYVKNYNDFIGKKEIQIDLTRFTAGVYTLILTNAKGKTTRKLIVN